MDLFGPTRSLSLSGKKYGYVLVDDFSRFTWVFFLTNKNEVFNEFQLFYRKIEQDGKYNVTPRSQNRTCGTTGHSPAPLWAPSGVHKVPTKALGTEKRRPM